MTEQEKAVVIKIKQESDLAREQGARLASIISHPGVGATMREDLSDKLLKVLNLADNLQNMHERWSKLC